MKQQTFAAGDFERYRKPTRREHFLAEMNKVVPWDQLCALIEPYYPKPGNGRPPVGLERMLRIYFLQHWFNLSDPAAEEALYDSRSMCRFVGIDLGREPVPDESTTLGFRHLLEQHELGEALFQAVGEYLQAQGMRIASGTIVDASIITAPSSTKNQDKARDPEMHSTRKGKQWYFGMKAHIGVDSKTKQIHSVAATAANVHDRRCWTTCCTGARHGCGAIRPTPGRPRRCAGRRPVRRTSPTRKAGATNHWMMRPRRATARSRKSAPKWNMSLLSSSVCLASPRCATAAWRRMPMPCLCCVR